MCPHPTGSQAASHFRGRAARVSASEALDRAQDQSVTQSNPPHLNGSLTRNGAARSPAGTGEPAETPRTTNGASVSGPSTSPVMAMAPLTSGGIAKESPPQRASSLTRPGIAAAAKTESSAGRIEVESQTGSKAKRETSQSQSPKAPRGVRSSSSFVVGQAPETPPSIFEYFQSSATLDPDDDGPPRFFCPLDGKPREDASQEVLPRLFFLPGIEGTGFGLALHHKSLARWASAAGLKLSALSFWGRGGWDHSLLFLPRQGPYSSKEDPAGRDLLLSGSFKGKRDLVTCLA